jgi:hypothetical protein
VALYPGSPGTALTNMWATRTGQGTPKRTTLPQSPQSQSLLLVSHLYLLHQAHCKGSLRWASKNQGSNTHQIPTDTREGEGLGTDRGLAMSRAACEGDLMLYEPQRYPIPQCELTVTLTQCAELYTCTHVWIPV